MTEAERIAQELDDNADLDAAEGGNPDVCKLEHDAAALIRQQAAEIERLRVDAARYRFLADTNNWDIAVELISNIDFTEADFNSAVDEAIKENKHD